MTRSTILAAALAAAAVAPTTAGAATISYEGDTLVYRAAPGEANRLIVDKGYEDGTISLSDYAPRAFPADRCTTLGEDHGVDCQAVANVRVELGDGDDEGSFGLLAPAGTSYVIDGGPGNDRVTGLRADRGAATVVGGDGDDVLTSFDQGETLDGGAGNDRLEGAGGADALLAGPGSDALAADLSSQGSRFFSDVIDGGPGADSVDDYHSGIPRWPSRSRSRSTASRTMAARASTTTSGASSPSRSARSAASSATTRRTCSTRPRTAVPASWTVAVAATRSSPATRAATRCSAARGRTSSPAASATTASSAAQAPT